MGQQVCKMGSFCLFLRVRVENDELEVGEGRLAEAFLRVFVKSESFKNPLKTINVGIMGCQRIKRVNISPF